MTTISTVHRSAAARAQVHGELVDLLIESVVLPQDPVARAAVICNLLSEMCAAVEWLHGPELSIDGMAGGEVASLRQLLAAGRDHHQRMKTLGP